MNIEPFDAYIVRVAGATLVIALVGAIAALFVPMVYCRYGCPTGKLLEFLRRNGRSDRLTLRDGLAVLCVLGAALSPWPTDNLLYGWTVAMAGRNFGTKHHLATRAASVKHWPMRTRYVVPWAGPPKVSGRPPCPIRPTTG